MTTTLTELDDLLSGPVTGDEGRTFVRDLIATAPEPIPLEVLDTPGTPENAIIYALGEAEAQRSADRLQFAKSAFRSTASLGWLRIVAREEFGLEAKGADFATTQITIANIGGGTYGPFAPSTLRFRNSTTDKIYLNQEEVTIGVGPFSVVTGIIAEEPGSASNAQVGEIDALETPLAGVAVVNGEPAFGQDQESAPALNDRITARIGAVGVAGAGFATGATASVYESLAKNGPDNGGGVVREDGSRITVTRAAMVKNLVTNTITIYLADDDGPLASGDLILVRAVLVAYAEWIGSTVSVFNAVAVDVTVNAALTIRGTPIDADILAQIDVELAAASRNSPIGGFPSSGGIPAKFVENAVEAAGDAGKPTAFTLIDIDLTTPAGLTALSASQVAVLARGLITITRD